MEVMVSMVVVVTTFYLLSNFNDFYFSKSANLRRACEAHAESVIAAVQEETYYRFISTFRPVDATRTPPANTFTGTTAIPTGSVGLYWPTGGFSQIVTDGALNIPPQLHNQLLIQGSMRTLAAIYNSGIRCNFAAYGPLTNLPMSEVLTDPDVAAVAQMRIEPFNNQSGISLCGAAAVWPAPRGVAGTSYNNRVTVYYDQSGEYLNSEDGSGPRAEMHPLGGNSWVAQRFNAASTDVAFQMSVRVSYNFEGQAYSCSASQRFEYPMDNQPPPRPDFARVAQNTSLDQQANNTVILRDYCSMGAAPINTAANVVIEAGYNVNTPVEPGVQFMCKDLSWQRQADPSVTMAECRNAGMAVIAQQPFDPDPARFNTANLQFLASDNYANRTDYWQPCDLVRQCGVAPNIPVTYTGNMLTLTYNNVPAGCVMNFEILAVDTAGNRSGNRGLPATKRFLETPRVTYNSGTVHHATRRYSAAMEEIYLPNCGTAFDPTFYRSGLGYYCPTGGYYRCGAATACGP